MNLIIDVSRALVLGLLRVLFRYSASHCFRTGVCNIAGKPPAGVSTEMDPTKRQGVSSRPLYFYSCTFSVRVESEIPSGHDRQLNQVKTCMHSLLGEVVLIT